MEKGNGNWTLDNRNWTMENKYCTMHIGCDEHYTMHLRYLTLNKAFWGTEIGNKQWTMDNGYLTMDNGPLTMNNGNLKK